MRRIFFLLPLLFFWLAAPAQLFPSRSNIVVNPTANAEADIVGVNTTADGMQVYAFFGDSNMDGRSPTILTVPPQTLYHWNGSSNVEITTQSISNDDNTKGGLQQQFAIDYKALSGFKTIAVQRGAGGSGVGDWDGTGVGDLYPASKAAVDAALAFNGLTKPKYIVINLALNDVGGGLVNIRNSTITLIKNLTTDYSGVPIVWVQVGRGSSTVSQSMYDVRSLLISNAESNNLLYMTGAPALFVGAGWMLGDNLHFTADGYNYLGACLVRWIGNKRFTNKWARAVISSHVDVLSDARKDVVNYIITRAYNRGDYFKIEGLNFFRTTTQNNIYFDWSFLGFVSGAPSSFSANAYTAGNGTSTNLTWSWIPLYNRRSSQTNFRIMAYLRDRLTADASTARLFGASDGTSQFGMGQNGSATTYQAVDATVSTGAESNLVDGNWYGIGRDSGTKYIFKNKTTNASVSVATVAAVGGVAPRIFAFNNNGSIANHMSAQIECIVAAPLTGFDWDSMLDDLDYYRANW